MVNSPPQKLAHSSFNAQPRPSLQPEDARPRVGAQPNAYWRYVPQTYELLQRARLNIGMNFSGLKWGNSQLNSSSSLKVPKTDILSTLVARKRGLGGLL
jgi:hypothetical protein